MILARAQACPLAGGVGGWLFSDFLGAVLLANGRLLSLHPKFDRFHIETYGLFGDRPF